MQISKYPDLSSIDSDSNTIVIQAVEAALLAHPLINDCAVLLRATAGAPELVAYTVSTEPVSVDQLQAHLSPCFSPAEQPSLYIPVAALPLTEQGEIDQQALLALAAVDAELLQRWENSIQSISTIERVAVVPQAFSEPMPLLHLSDLLLEQKPAVGSPASGDAAAAPQMLPPSATAIDLPPIAQVLAQAEGGELPPPKFATLAEMLRQTALEASDRGILYLQPDGSELFQSYPDLLEASQRILNGLKQLGLQPQDKVIFQLDCNADFIPAFWGCLLGGFVPVPLAGAPTYDSENSATEKLRHISELLQPSLVLVSQSLKLPIRSLFERLGSSSPVASIELLRACPPDQAIYSGQPDDLALLIFTSGSTGRPKGVMLNHRNILSNIASSVQVNQVSRADICLNWLHLDHVGSLIRCCIRDVYVGCQQIHAPSELVLADPLKWLDWIEQYRVTYAWGPNFALGLVNAQLAQLKSQIQPQIEPRQRDLSSLKSLLSVAEVTVPQTAQRFLELLASAGLSAQVMHSAWGMTETGAAVLFSHRYLLELEPDSAFVEVGIPVPGLSARIVDDQGQILPEGTSGLLQIKGPMVTDGYYENPELTQAVFTADGWLKTGDLALMRNGRLTVTGRQKDIIIINGLNHYSHEIEAVVEEISGVEPAYTAACAVRTAESETDQLAIFFHPVETSQLVKLLKAIRGIVTRKIQVNPTYLIPVEKTQIPKTGIGKIQRSMLRQQFEAGKFDSVLKQIDILTGSSNTVPDWFYQRVWQPRLAVARSAQIPNGQTILFLDPLGLGQALADCLCAHSADGASSQPCIQVTVGPHFIQLSPSFYQIDPTQPDHYAQLIRAVAATGPIARILHLWTYSLRQPLTLETLQQAQERGVYSILFLVQALHQIQATHPVQLLIVSSQAQATSLQAEVAYEKAPLLGLIKTIPQELPQIDCRHLDLTAADRQADLAALLQEMRVLQRQPEVAYRRGQRLVPYLQKLNLPQSPKQALPFKPGGLYLLSGGLGEIAVEIARYLLKHYKARLLLLGRSPLPGGLAETLDRRTHAYESLRQLGAVSYAAVDICDLASLQQSVERAKQQWRCELDGVIHLAGIGQDCLLRNETPASFAATLRPKLFGTWALHQLVTQQPDAVFISFSSVLSVQGSLGVGAYAAANRFLDHFWHYQQQSPQLKSYCFGSSTWAGVGISRGYEARDSRYAQGREVMSVEQGLHSLLASLHYGPAHLLAGLDGNHPQIRQQRRDTSPQAQQICAYFTADPATNRDELYSRLELLKLSDRFATAAACQFHQVAELPLTAAGEIDYTQLGAGQKSPYVAPSTELEQQLASIWQAVLGLTKVGIHDNFFELGGSSLLALQLFAQIEQTFGERLPLASLFQAITIEQQAKLLKQEKLPSLWSSLVAIQPHGTQPAVFAVHGLYGDILFYRDLVQHLGPDQPFYGLQAQGLDQQQPGLTRIEEMAAHYLQEIQTLQPEGPYLLAGYSLGGLIAFEMAQQLHQQGQTVSLLALLDTWNLCHYEHLSYFKKLPRRQRLSLHLKNLLQLPLSQQFAYMTEKLKARITSYLGSQQPPSTEELWRRATIETNQAAAANYAPQVYPGKVTLFATVETELEFYEYFDPKLGWAKLAAGGVELRQVAGEHLTMMEEPHVQQLAEQLRDAIKEAVSGR